MAKRNNLTKKTIKEFNLIKDFITKILFFQVIGLLFCNLILFSAQTITYGLGNDKFPYSYFLWIPVLVSIFIIIISSNSITKFSKLNRICFSFFIGIFYALLSQLFLGISSALFGLSMLVTLASLILIYIDRFNEYEKITDSLKDEANLEKISFLNVKHNKTLCLL